MLASGTNNVKVFYGDYVNRKVPSIINIMITSVF
jgi:hypothetical protein